MGHFVMTEKSSLLLLMPRHTTELLQSNMDLPFMDSFIKILLSCKKYTIRAMDI